MKKRKTLLALLLLVLTLNTQTLTIADYATGYDDSEDAIATSHIVTRDDMEDPIDIKK